MVCNYCGTEIPINNNFCGSCGQQKNLMNIHSGDGGINIAGSNSFSNSPIHVGNVYSNSEV